jgi:hypothetical protein
VTPDPVDTQIRVGDKWAHHGSTSWEIIDRKGDGRWRIASGSLAASVSEVVLRENFTPSPHEARRPVDTAAEREDGLLSDWLEAHSETATVAEVRVLEAREREFRTKWHEERAAAEAREEELRKLSKALEDAAVFLRRIEAGGASPQMQARSALSVLAAHAGGCRS